MEREESLAIFMAAEQVDSILLLSNMAECAIETDLTKKVWDLYLLFGVIKKLSEGALEELRKIQD